MYLADCISKQCEWDYLCEQFTSEQENEKFGRALEVFHTLVKHPEEYRRMTKKEPERSEFQYRDLLEEIGHLL